jgi:hypothetical protein
MMLTEAEKVDRYPMLPSQNLKGSDPSSCMAGKRLRKIIAPIYTKGVSEFRKTPHWFGHQSRSPLGLSQWDMTSD